MNFVELILWKNDWVLLIHNDFRVLPWYPFVQFLALMHSDQTSIYNLWILLLRTCPSISCGWVTKLNHWASSMRNVGLTLLSPLFFFYIKKYRWNSLNGSLIHLSIALLDSFHHHHPYIWKCIPRGVAKAWMSSVCGVLAIAVILQFYRMKIKVHV